MVALGISGGNSKTGTAVTQSVMAISVEQDETSPKAVSTGDLPM